MECYEARPLSLLYYYGFVLANYAFDLNSDLFEIVSSLKDSYLASTSLLRLPEGHPRAILTAFL